MKTAVEWLDAHVNRVIDLHKRKLISEDKFRSLLIEYRKQAKAMEKEQIIEAYAYGVKETRSRCEYEDFNEYYNETFKSE